MQQHVAGCPPGTRFDARVSRPVCNLALHRLPASSSSSGSRQLMQQRLAVSCPAIEQDTEVPSTSGRRHTDSDLINALFQSDQQSLVGFAEADLLSGSPTYAKELSNRIKAADSLSHLCDLIQLEAPHFTHKSTSHALHKLSLLCSTYFTQLPSDNLTSRESQQAAWIEHVEPALQTLGQLLIRHMADCDPWAVTISFWAYGNLQCSDEAVVAALCERGLQIMQELTPHDCAAALVGIAKLRVRPRCQREFVDVLLNHTYDLLSRVDCWRTQEIANVLWALSRIGATGPSRRGVLEGLLEMTMWRLQEFRMMEICLIVYSCGRLQLRLPLQLERITEHIAARMSEMNPLDAAHVVWGCAKLGIHPGGDLLERLPQVMVGQLTAAKPQEICNLLYGYGALHYKHPLLLEAVAQACPQRLQDFSTQDVCLTIWAYGRLGYHPKSSELFDTACCVLLQRSNRLIPLQLTMAVKSCARVKYQPAPQFMQQISQLAVQKLHQFSALELSQLLWAYARLGYRDVQLFEAAVATFIQTLGNRRMPKTTIDTVVLACEMVGFWPQLLVDAAEMRGVIVKTTRQSESGDMEQLLPLMPEAAVSSLADDAFDSSDGRVQKSVDDVWDPQLLLQQQSQQQLDLQHQHRPAPQALTANSMQWQRISSSIVLQEQQQEEHQQQQQHEGPQRRRDTSSISILQQQQQPQQQHSAPVQLLRPPSWKLRPQDPGAAVVELGAGCLLQVIRPTHALANGGSSNSEQASSSSNSEQASSSSNSEQASSSRNSSSHSSVSRDVTGESERDGDAHTQT